MAMRVGRAAGGDLELPVDRLQVGVDGMRADDQALRDLDVGEAISQQAEHVNLASRQARWMACRDIGRRWTGATRCQHLVQRRSDLVARKGGGLLEGHRLPSFPRSVPAPSATSSPVTTRRPLGAGLLPLRVGMSHERAQRGGRPQQRRGGAAFATGGCHLRQPFERIGDP